MGRTQRLRARRKGVSGRAECDFQVIIDLLKELGRDGWRNDTKLQVRDFPATGRGLCSKLNIPRDRCIISLPFGSLISLANLELDVEFRNIFRSAGKIPKKELSFQSLLAFYILFHQHKVDTKYRAYLQTIPKFFTNPFFCAQTELNFLPDNVLEKIVEQNNEIKASFALLSSVASSSVCSCCDSPTFPNIFDLNRFRWAYFAVNSRCVYVDPAKIVDQITIPLFLNWIKDEPKLALAPFLDLFNHSDMASTISSLSADEHFRYELITGCSYFRYNQVFISYGPLTNFKLLVDYGFYLPGNRHDLFEFTLHDMDVLMRAKKIVVHRNKFKFIKDHNLDSQMFVHSSDGPSHNLLVVLYLIFVEQSPFPNILSQTAFGSTEHFGEAVQDEIAQLVRCKIDEYGKFLGGFESIEEITESGKVVRGYLMECVAYLNKFLENYVYNVR